MIETRPTLAPQRTHITLAFSGEKDLALPKIGPRRETYTLKAGAETNVPIGYFHAIGADTATAALIADGTIKPVCRAHVFAEGDDNCNYCHFTREMAADERAAKAPKKGPQPAIDRFGAPTPTEKKP